MKYVVVSGGVVSGLGKGITSSSIGLLLRKSGLRVTAIKIDPYLCVDASTMSPYEHGEVYVLNDGGEADLDLGNYERFLDVTLTRDHNITTGKVYLSVINAERKGEYLGKTVQVVPHITDAIQNWIERVAQIPVDGSGLAPEVCLIELGGTVGDIESMVFLEALRQLRFRVGSDNFCLVHVSLVPVLGSVGEAKSKPTQHGVKELLTTGLHPDIIVCRSSKTLSRSIIAKISMFCMVPSTHVVAIHDVPNVFEVPLLMLKQRVPGLVIAALRLNKMPPEDLPDWRALSARVTSMEATAITIAIVGKYTGLSDSYLSVIKALFHAGLACGFKVDIEWVESSDLEPAHERRHPEEHAAAWAKLKAAAGILIPGGFGDRGIEGKILAVEYCRTSQKPFFGICLGMQVAVIEHARNVAGLVDADSSEWNEHCPEPVVMYMPEISRTHMGGTMRLGLRTCQVARTLPAVDKLSEAIRQAKVEAGSAVTAPPASAAEDPAAPAAAATPSKSADPDSEPTLAYVLYGNEAIQERHRHRYEVNPDYVERLAEAGLIFSGTDGIRMEIIERPRSEHPFFFAAQFHPEFNSRPLKPSPAFVGFVLASAGQFDWTPLCENRSLFCEEFCSNAAPRLQGRRSPGRSSPSGRYTPE